MKYQVKKRSGEIVGFDIKKIEVAITKAFTACEKQTDDDVIELLALRVVSDFEKGMKETGENIVDIETIQDSVERTLIKAGYDDVAKKYILYRKQHENVRETVKTLMDTKKTVEKYLNVEDWRVKENSTVRYSIGGLILSNSGAVTADYWLNQVYDKEIADAHRKCDMHIHDLSMLSGYCAGWSLKQLIQEGLGGVTGKITSLPAGHLSTLCNQMVNFLGIMQNEWAGAQAFSSFDTYLAPFVKADNLNYKQVKQCIQSFVYGVNTPSRWGCVDTDTEVLSIDGFKKYNELKEGDLIYTWREGKLDLTPVLKVIQKPFKGKLHSYKARGYNQTVTPTHRMLVFNYNDMNECVIKRSEEVFNSATPYNLPVGFIKDPNIHMIENSDYEIMLAAIIYTDGSLDYRNGHIHKVKIFKSPKRKGNIAIQDILEHLQYTYTVKEKESSFGKVFEYTLYGEDARRIESLIGSKKSIHKRFMNLNKSQAELFLRTWAVFDGIEEKMLCQYDNDTIRDQLQQIALCSGHCSYVIEYDKKNNAPTRYVKIRKRPSIIPKERVEVDYDGIVWCPNVETGTAVFRKDGCVYISGQTQAPFTNITLDWTVPNDLAELNCIVGGKEMPYRYKDCEEEMRMINKAFLEIMIEGDANGRGFQYPIPTYSITRDFNWSDTENNRLLFEMTAKYGTPYFSNYVNSDMEPSDIRSMCCRLRLDLRELRKKSGGFFGSGESTGSIGVVTLNMPRMAYQSKTEAEFYERLDKLMDIAARSLDIKRRAVTKWLDNGLYPYTKRYLGTFKNHFSTIGLVGMNEAGLNACWLGKDLTHKETQDFAKAVLNHMRERLSDYQVKYGDLFNLEATPAESTSFRFAKHDKEDFPDIITATKSCDAVPYYTNSSHLPVGYTADVFEALDVQDELQTLYTSGTVFHAFLGEKLPDWRAAANLVRKIAENYKLPYYTLSPTYSVCSDHGYLVGEQGKCPICGKPTEIYSRITGYYRPVQDWNDGKAQEYRDRREYAIGLSTVPHKTDNVRDCTDSCQIESTTPESVSEKKLILVASKTCPNCKAAKMFLDKAGIEYDVMYADDEPEKVRALGVTQAPTLIKTDENGNIFRYIGVSGIRKATEIK